MQHGLSSPVSPLISIFNTRTLHISNVNPVIKMPGDIRDKDGQSIKAGDEVWTKARGGKHEGTVDKVVTTEAEAERSGVKNPPKVS